MKENQKLILRPFKITLSQFKLLSVSILLCVLFLPSIIKLMEIWKTDDNYSHGFFVIPVFIYMVWQKRGQLSKIIVKPEWAGSVFLVIGLALYCITFAANFHTLNYLSIIIIILSAIIFLAGWKFAVSLFLPVLFLLFMFPIPSSIYVQLTNPLKIFITDISAHIISFTGIPVYQEGNLLYFTNTQLEVVEACSGLRSLFSYAMLGCVFSVFCDKMSRKLILVLSTIPLSVCVNLVRVTGTGFLSHYYGEKAAQGFFHEFTGMIFFLIGLLFLFCEYHLLESGK